MYRDGIELNSQTTSNILDERHPLTWMAEDDEFAEQIDTTSKYFEEEPKGPHPTAVGKSGGCEDRFIEIEFNLQPPHHPAVEPLDEMVVENNPDAMVLPDEIEPEIIAKNNPHVGESEEKA